MRPALPILGILVVLAAAGCGRTKARDSSSAPRLDVRREIEDLVASRGAGLGLADTSALESTWQTLERFYARRHHRPAWSGAMGISGRLAHVQEAIARASELGLDPRDYEHDRLRGLLTQIRRKSALAEQLRPRNLARLDVFATYAYLRLWEHLRHGRVPRAALDPEWVVPAASGESAERALERDPGTELAKREPPYEGYRRLKEALARHRDIAARGGWPALPPGPPLSVGARGPRVAALVRRLAITGDLPAPVRDTVYDRRLEHAVGELQTRYGLPRSGILGDATRSLLNVPVETRIRQMELNLERWRWLPESLGTRHVEINIPAYRLELVREGKVARAMRVVVGKRKSPTPVFSDQLTYLEVNPTWTLPTSVVAKEIVPALRRRPDYLEANHMVVISIADAKRDTVDPATVPWKDAASDSFMYLVIQAPGPDNPLGQIKLMCPNEYDVYLHDSPLRSRFSVAVRDYSHGCVRVEEAVDLADSLLVWTAPRDTTQLDTLIASGAWKRMRLSRPVPVHFLYWTAWVDPLGRLHYREDLYGLDQRLDEALRRRATWAFVLNPGVEVSRFWAAAEARARERAAKRAGVPPGVPAASASTRGAPPGTGR